MRKRFLSLLLGLTIFLSTSLSFAAYTSPVNVLGSVMGTGNAQMTGGFGKQIPLSGKSFPVVNGAHITSGNGSASISMNNTNLTMGKSSEIVVSGQPGSYSVNLLKGSLSYSVPQGVDLTVNTPTSVVKAPTGTSAAGSQRSVTGMVTSSSAGTTTSSNINLLNLSVKNILGIGNQGLNLNLNLLGIHLNLRLLSAAELLALNLSLGRPSASPFIP